MTIRINTVSIALAAAGAIAVASIGGASAGQPPKLHNGNPVAVVNAPAKPPAKVSATPGGGKKLPASAQAAIKSK